jgi:hypothetical protein
MHFLDTDTLTHAHLGHRKVASRIERAGERNVATTIVTAIEHRACVNDRPPCLHHVCTDLVPRDLVVRGHLLTLVVREKIMEVGESQVTFAGRMSAVPLPLSHPHGYRSIIAYLVPGPWTNLGPGGAVHQIARWRGHATFSLLSSKIHGLIASPTTTSSATAIGNLKRRGPALPGLT